MRTVMITMHWYGNLNMFPATLVYKKNKIQYFLKDKKHWSYETSILRLKALRQD